ncbi:MAG: MMPL family transporter, partial [Solirubrobacteraceae bacterium]
DYAIQFQSRVSESLAETDQTPRNAVLAAVRDGAPAITTAALASAAAMLVLGLSPVPTVQGFGLLLVLGIVLALLVALTIGSAVLTLSLPARAGSSNATIDAGVIKRLGTPATTLAGAWRGARVLLAENPLNRFISRTALEQAARRPQRVLLVGVALAALGWGLGTQTQVQTDISKLVPQNTGSLQALQELERMSGVGGEIDLMVSGKDLTKPSVISWMSSYQQRILNHFHYSEAKGCGKAQLCPAFSLPDIFQGISATTNTQTGTGGTQRLNQAEIDGLLGAIPPYFSEDVISANHRAATLAFGIRLMGLSEQQRVIEAMRSELHPPKGVSAHLVGLAVLAAQSGAAVSSVPRRMLNLALALVAILLVLFVAFGGDRSRVLVTALPVILASGWSSLVLFAIRVPLNPLSVTLDALVIAISTEFSVLLCARHRQERAAGHSPSEALRRSYERTGAAIAASALTAIAGFGVLVLSDISMLRDFGLVTLVDLSVALLGVLIVLPSALMFFERGEFERPLIAPSGRLSRLPSRLARIRFPRRSPHETA